MYSWGLESTPHQSTYGQQDAFSLRWQQENPCFLEQAHQINSCEYLSILTPNYRDNLGRVLGTPNEKSWPTITELPDYKVSLYNV